MFCIFLPYLKLSIIFFISTVDQQNFVQFSISLYLYWMLIFFLVAMMKQWNRFPREEVDATSLVTFKVRLDRALTNLTELKMLLLIAEELRLDEI